MNSMIKNLRDMEPGIILIIIYGIFQGVQTFYHISKKLTLINMRPTDASINLLYLILAVTVIVGSVGLLIKKKWGSKVTIVTYGCILPLIFFSVLKTDNADPKFYMSCAIDIIVAGIILTYLSSKLNLNKNRLIGN